MRRLRSKRVAERNEGLVVCISEIKADHPFWGYRRVWAHLRYVDGIIVNQKRVYRLMREHNLTVNKETRNKAKRTSNRPKPRPETPNEWWGIDMTKVMVDGFGWVYIVVMLDWYTKKIVGHYADMKCTSQDWLSALDTGLNAPFPCGARDKGLHLMSDNGSQPTSKAFMKTCSILGVHQTFTSYNNPKGNADTERMIRTLKEELIWLREWTSLKTLKQELEKWITYYNTSYLHSSLGYMPPDKFEQLFWTNTLNLSA